MFITPPLEKRRDEWRQSIGERLQQLESESISIEDLKSNEGFVSTVMHASAVALRSHQQEKLDALRNAVTNAALPNPPDESLQQIFIRLIDELTVWHIRFLELFQDPHAWFKRNGMQPPDFAISSSSDRVLAVAYPELHKDRDLYELIASDLASRKLYSGTMHAMLSATGAMEKQTTRLGDQFLAFIHQHDRRH